MRTLMRLAILSLCIATLAGEALAAQLPVEAKVQQLRDQRKQLRQTAPQLRGLSTGGLQELAFWRDRTLRTPEVKQALQKLTRYLKAHRELAKHNGYRDLPDALRIEGNFSQLALSGDGQVHVLGQRWLKNRSGGSSASTSELRAITDESARWTDGEAAKQAILRLAEQAEKDDPKLRDQLFSARRPSFFRRLFNRY